MVMPEKVKFGVCNHSKWFVICKVSNDFISGFKQFYTCPMVFFVEIKPSK